MPALPRLLRGRSRLVPDGRLQSSAGSRGSTASRASSSLEDPAQLVPIPRSLGRLGVLAEPASICERALRHARAIGGRQPWEPQRALVLGAGAVGTLSTYLLRLAGLEVWTASLEPSNDLVDGLGARYVPLPETPLAELGGVRPRRRGGGRRPADGRRARPPAAAAASRACSASTPRVQRVELDGRTLGARRDPREPRPLRQRQRRAARTGSQPSTPSTARASAGRTRSSSSSACACRSTASRTPSPTAAARRRSCSRTESGSVGDLHALARSRRSGRSRRRPRTRGSRPRTSHRTGRRRCRRRSPAACGAARARTCRPSR